MPFILTVRCEYNYLYTTLKVSITPSYYEGRPKEPLCRECVQLKLGVP